MIKRNIKIMTTGGIQVEKICGILDIEYEIDLSNHSLNIYFIIDNNKNFKVGYGGDNFAECTYPEVDADLFIRTNGTCEETFKEQQTYKDGDFVSYVNNSNSTKHKVFELSSKSYIDYNTPILKAKLKKKNEILKKARIKRKNQKEELNKLNLKLQKCINMEELEYLKEDSKYSLKLKEDRIKSLEDCNERLMEQNKYLKDSLYNLIDIRNSQNKEIEKLKAIIEYLEGKAK